MADATPVQWSDPCARCTALQAAYYSLISGTQEVEIRTRTLDQEELVRFTKGDVTSLVGEIRLAQRDCAAQQGLPDPNRRFAITAGSRWDIGRRCGSRYFRPS